MSLVSGVGTPVLVTSTGTPMFDSVQLTLNPGHTKPAFVQIVIVVTIGTDVDLDQAVVSIL
jgi:hypothetical protein